jgi:hypothetical protein
MALKKSNEPIPNPLTAVPIPMDGVEARRDTGSLVQLNRRVQPARGISGWVSRVLGARRVRVNLDEQGSFFWERIDGQRNLAQIASELQQRFGTDPAAARQATVMFTRMLMLRHIIQLRVER